MTARYLLTLRHQRQRRCPPLKYRLRSMSPVHTAYNQWTQSKISLASWRGWSGSHRSGTRTCNGASILAAGKRSLETEITEQLPDQRIAWRTRGGTDNSGVVTFHRVSEGVTVAKVRNVWFSQGSYCRWNTNPKACWKRRAISSGPSRRVQGDLERFKAFSRTHWPPRKPWASSRGSYWQSNEFK